MKKLALAFGVLAVTAAAAASAQVYYERNYTNDPYRAPRTEYRDGRDECWNPGAGHFEAVRPGEVQNDLDFSRCRAVGSRYAERNAERRNWREGREAREAREECWNPRAGHFEEVRRGERQYDLDYSRCRVYR